MGRLLRCITSDGLVTASVLDSTDIVLDAARLHKATPVAAAALGRALTGAALMGSRLKEDNAGLTLRFSGGGPLGSIIAVSDSSGNVRGYVQEAGLLLSPKNGLLDIAGAVGKDGSLTVIKDYGYGQPYGAQCRLISGEIAEDLAGYYATSEQTPTVICLGVHFDGLWKPQLGGGLMIQLLPSADEREIVKLEASLKELPPLTTIMSQGKTLEEILIRVLQGFEVEFFPDEFCVYKCNCSKERVLRALMTIGRDELKKIAEQEEQTEMSCHFCNKKYYIGREEVLEMINENAEFRNK